MISRVEARAAIDRHDEETAMRLRDAQAAVEAAQLEAARLVSEAMAIRAGVIGEAVTDGWTMRRVADELGVSHQRVYQIRQGDPTRD